MKRTVILLFLGLAALLWGETVINGSRSILGEWNAGGAASTIPAKMGTELPAGCAVGEQFFKTDAAAGQNLHLCTAPDTWTQVAGAAVGGDSVCAPGDARYFCVVEDFVMSSTTSGQIGTLGWLTGGSGSTSGIAGVWPNVGVLRLTTGAVSGNMQRVNLTSTAPALGDWLADAARQHEVKFIFRLNSPADSNFRLVVGAINTANGLIDHGFAFGKGSDGTFSLINGAGGEVSQVSTGVNADAAWHTVKFHTDGTPQKLNVTLDESVTITACPAGGGCDMSTSAPFGYTSYSLSASVTTNAAAARTLDLDYISAMAVVGTDAGRRN